MLPRQRLPNGEGPSPTAPFGWPIILGFWHISQLRRGRVVQGSSPFSAYAADPCGKVIGSEHLSSSKASFLPKQKAFPCFWGVTGTAWQRIWT